MDFFKRRPNSPTFWDWLIDNTTRIQQTGQKGMPAMIAEIGAEFGKFYPNLVWEISVDKAGPWTFCISADGNPTLFASVMEAVKTAPTIDRWKIQAFRPRGSLNAQIDMGGQILGYDDIWCRIAPQGDGLAVQLCIRGLTKANDRALGGAALILLDNALGEFDALTRIKSLARAPLPNTPQRTDDFLPLADLPALIDRIRPSGLN